jgi:hypothetical protein
MARDGGSHATNQLQLAAGKNEDLEILPGTPGTPGPVLHEALSQMRCLLLVSFELASTEASLPGVVTMMTDCFPRRQ